MPSAVTLVIYVSAAVAADPDSAVLQRSAQEILGNQAQVTLRTSATELPDEILSSEAAQADAVADVAWLNDEHRRATVRCYVGKLHRVVKREVSFDEDADPSERERMLGFVVASMLLPEAEPDVAEPPRAAEEHPPKKESVPYIVAEPPAKPEHFVGMVELLGLGATGIGGPSSGFGAGLAGRWLFARSLSLRVAGGLRRGEVPEANANTEVEFASLGLGLALPLGPGSRFALGGHGSALILRHEVDRVSASSGSAEQKSRVIPGAEATLEASLRFSANAGFVAGVGAELAFGHTALLVKGNEVTQIPVLRGLAELGIQAQF